MIWMFPAFALLIKCVLFFGSDIRNKYIFKFLVSTFFLNLFELLAFFRLDYDLIILKLYYCSAIFTALYLLLLCCEISQSCRFFKNDVSIVVAGVLSATTFFTDMIVEDFTILPNHSITRVAGAYYFIFQIYTLFILLSSIFILIKNSFFQRDYYVKKRCLIALFAFTPFIMIPVILMCLMQIGYQVNMAGFLSLATCFMLFVFISSSNKHKLFYIMKFVPMSRERAYYTELKRLIDNFSLPATGERVDMKTLLKEVELLVIKNTNLYFTTQKEVAKLLNISESALSKKITKK